MTSYSAQTHFLTPEPRLQIKRGISSHALISDIELDQYYTAPHVAYAFYRFFKNYFNPRLFLMVEPSAGEGAFFRILPPGSLAYDVDPRYDGIITTDFLTVTLPSDRPIAIIGNPPFGRNASMAIKFFNHAARQAQVIAMIFPRSFRKASIENRLDSSFYLLAEITVPKNAFLFRSKRYNVPAVFQIWEKRDTLRTLQIVQTTHRDFQFTTPDRAQFAIQRVGTNAGRIRHDFSVSPNSHYFIRGEVEAIMAQLDFKSVIFNVAGIPSLSKSEIIVLYDKHMLRNSG